MCGAVAWIFIFPLDMEAKSGSAPWKFYVATIPYRDRQTEEAVM